MNNKTQEKYHQQKNRVKTCITSFNIINEKIAVKYNLWVILAYSG